MADVTISQLTPGVPAGGNIVPYSTGTVTLGVPVSAMFHNAGNIGIGISNPQFTLDLTNTSDTGERAIRIFNGSLRDLLIGVEGSSANRFLGSSINNAFVGSSSSAGLELATNNSVRMYINSGGNVGIGTTSPSTKLEVDGTIKATALQVPGTVIQTISLNNLTNNNVGNTPISFNAASITPRFASSKILISTGTVIHRTVGNSTDYYEIQLRRGETSLTLLADAALYQSTGNGLREFYNTVYLDSPGTISSITYSGYVIRRNGTQGVSYATINQGNGGYITLQEIAQ